MKKPRRAAVASTGIGVLTIATGLYFMLLRPPMLPEDVRFTGVPPFLFGENFTRWLSIVFRTWGGFVVGFGVLLTSLGAFLWSGDVARLRRGAAAAVVFAFGSFLVSNVQIGSAFSWYVGVLFASSIVLAWMLLGTGSSP